MPTFVIFVTGSTVQTMGSVMNLPPSAGQHLSTGSSKEVDLVPGQDDLLAGRFFHGLGKKIGKFRQFRQHLELVHQAGTGPRKEVDRVHDVPDLPADIIKVPRPRARGTCVSWNRRRW